MSTGDLHLEVCWDHVFNNKARADPLVSPIPGLLIPVLPQLLSALVRGSAIHPAPRGKVLGAIWILL